MKSAPFEAEPFIRAHLARDFVSPDDIVNSKAKEKYPIPFLTTNQIKHLIEDVTKLFETESVLLKLSGPVIIVGDLHGHLFDLYRIFLTFEAPPKNTFLFLGDLVDRGPFSIEVVTLIYAMKLTYPDNVYIIRGNHEFRSIALTNGFFAEIETLYSGSDVFERFCDSFAYIPLAAVIDDEFFCCHAGLSPDMQSIEQIQQIQLPLVTHETQLASGLLWSDPDLEISGFGRSPRGSGFIFGQDVLCQFLSANNLKTMIRGHECVAEGAQFLFDGHLITVFSASNYCGTTMNKSAVLRLENGLTKAYSFAPCPLVKRNRTVLKKVKSIEITVSEIPQGIFPLTIFDLGVSSGSVFSRSLTSLVPAKSNEHLAIRKRKIKKPQPIKLIPATAVQV